MNKQRIVSRGDRPFEDRKEAGAELALELTGLRSEHPVILGIPRGGVEVAAEIARVLEGDLDVVMARKVASPHQPEYALGAVTESGRLFLNPLESPGREELHKIREWSSREHGVLMRRLDAYRAALPKLPLKDRVVVVTDDGAATGLTFEAALSAAREERPRRLIAALPVAPEATVKRIAGSADLVVCLRCPGVLFSVGQFYVNFEPFEDDAVLGLLKEEAKRRHHHAGV